MSKSILTICGLGAAGCVVLSLGMQRIAEHAAAGVAPPYAAAVEARFAARLTAPLRIGERRTGDTSVLHVAARVDDLAGAPRLAAAIADEVLLLAQRGGTWPDEVLVELRDRAGAPPFRHRHPAPARARESAMAPAGAAADKAAPPRSR